MQTKQFCMTSKLGFLYLVASEKGLRGVYQKKQDAENLLSPVNADAAGRILNQAARELKEYFDGRRKSFTVPLDAVGTSFQKQVWKALRTIPYGKTCSYKDIAQKIKNPKALRAVGGANGKNPLCIVVPCHRVIAADGSLGGYSGGLKMKQMLLEVESRGGLSDFQAGR